MIAWSNSPWLINRIVELSSLGYTQIEIAKILGEEFPEDFPEPPTRDAVKNAYARNVNKGKIRERERLYNEHMESDLHEGDNYVEGCPTCYPPEYDDDVRGVTGTYSSGIDFTVPREYIGLTIGYFDIETTFSTQPIMLYGAIADGWGSVRQFNKGKNITDDRDLVNAYARALEEYDILVSWNGKLFDIPVISARLAYHRLQPIIRGKHIDAMYYASGNSMRLGRRSLQSVSEYFNSDNRKSPLSVRTWDAAMAGSEEAYDLIRVHCDADVLVLREVFGSLKSQISNIHR